MTIDPPPDDEDSRRAALDAAYSRGLSLWKTGELAALTFLVDPVGIGGVHLRGPAGPVRDLWINEINRLKPARAPLVSIPAGTPEGRLIGGVSIERSLQSGTLTAERGLLADAHGGIALLRMAEQMEPADAAPIAAALEHGEVCVERAGSSRRDPAQFGLIALDEGIGLEERAPENLTERLGLAVGLGDIPSRITAAFEASPADLVKAQALYPRVFVDEAVLEALVSAAIQVGISSLRAPLFCLRAAKALAALGGEARVSQAHARNACVLVYGHLAPPPEPESEREAPPPPPETAPPAEDTSDGLTEGALEDTLVEAVRNAALLGALQDAARADAQRRAHAEGRSGVKMRGGAKGRPDRPRPATGRRTGRIDLLSTLRAAAPWQKLRGRGTGRLKLRPSDLHVKRHRHRAESSVVFVVDASGSAALNRLADVKGAIEVLLSECYARRDYVSLVAFRGEAAETLLPPTRSLTRVRRALAGLPAGGTTPLADGLTQARVLADLETQRGRTPLLVILSDGRGNVALDGTTEREAADADTDKAARMMQQVGGTVLFFDTSRRPSPRARHLSETIGAAYAPLPATQASKAVASAVRKTIGHR
ncbi:MAG: VWA domain-containing protein [Pseudomonadota bacterium]